MKLDFEMGWVKCFVSLSKRKKKQLSWFLLLLSATDFFINPSQWFVLEITFVHPYFTRSRLIQDWRFEQDLFQAKRVILPWIGALSFPFL